MFDELVFSIEFFQTIFALEILLVEMSPLVVLACSICLEALWAYLTVMWSDASMSSLMVVPVSFLIKDLWTISARINSSFRRSLLSLLINLESAIFKEWEIKFFL